MIDLPPTDSLAAYDLPALVAQCAPGVGSSTMHAVIRTESAGKPWAINDNSGKLDRQPRTKAEAVHTAQKLIKLGHSIDIGLGQINSKNLQWLALTVEEAFDPCTNLAAAATVLSEAYKRASKVHGKGQPALLAALSAYNTGSLVNGFTNGYVRKVVSNAGVKVDFSVPALASGAVVEGRLGAVRVQQDGIVTPYNAPLASWPKETVQEPDSKRDGRRGDPFTAPLASEGFFAAAE